METSQFTPLMEEMGNMWGYVICAWVVRHLMEASKPPPQVLANTIQLHRLSIKCTRTGMT